MGRDVVARVALPLVTATGLPKAPPPTSNWTVPVAVDGATVAVTETELLANWGDEGVTEREVVVGTAVTTYEEAPVDPLYPFPRSA